MKTLMPRTTRRTPKPWQTPVIQWFPSLKNLRGMLLMDPGTGKTFTAIRCAEQIQAQRGLVLCRRDDYMTWVDELSTEGYPAEVVLPIESGKDIIGIDNAAMPTRWILCTYDMLRQRPVFDALRAYRPHIVIGDEVQALKHGNSIRTARAHALTKDPSITAVIAMTGTPISNSPRDIWSIAKFCDQGRTFGENEYVFLNKYFANDSYNKWYFLRKEKKAFAPKLASISFRVDKEVSMKLPPIRRIIKSVPMTKRQRTHYKTLLLDFEVELQRSPRIEIDYVTDQLEKLRQIATGFVYVTDPGYICNFCQPMNPGGYSHGSTCTCRSPRRKAVWLSDNKVNLVVKMITDKDYLADRKKVIVWCARTATIKRISNVLSGAANMKHVLLFGSNAKRNNAARVRFRDDPDCRVFVGQVDKGVGMNELMVSNTAIYVENSLKAERRQQSEARIRRQGTAELHSFVEYYDICSEGTQDLELVMSLRRMENFATSMLRTLKENGSILPV